MLDLALVMALGFLGSFGHCAGMCGPLVMAFSLSRQDPEGTYPAPQHPAPQHWSQRIRFQLLLTLGRLLSYGLVGALVGSLGSVVVAGGHLAGIGSPLRQGITILTGSLLVGLGLHQINPRWIPDLPFWHPFKRASLHERLHQAMLALSHQQRWWTPTLLGMAWGLIPCGFLYTAQIRAAETGSFAQGLAMMLAFGLGTAPTMIGVGLSSSLLSADRRSQLFRAGGWITLGMGILLVLRTDAMVDLTGYGSLLALMLALVARPISRLWPTLLRYRRGLGMGSLLLALAHTGHMMAHTLAWNLEGMAFLIPRHQWGLGLGSLALGLMIPAGVTSFDGAVRALGSRWRQLHLLSLPALGLAVGHCLLTGYRFWAGSQPNGLAVGVLLSLALAVVLVRCRWVWMLFAQEKVYVAPSQIGSSPSPLAPSRDPAAESRCHPS